MVESDDGRYCLYSDHLQELAHEKQISDDVVKDNEILKGRIERLRDALGGIKAVATLDAICEATNVKIIKIAREALKEG